jgi:hypothetical protein
LEELVVFLLGSSSEKAGPRDDRPTSCGHVALFFQRSLRVRPPPPPQLLPPELHDDEQETQASPDLVGETWTYSQSGVVSWGLGAEVAEFGRKV